MKLKYSLLLSLGVVFSSMAAQTPADDLTDKLKNMVSFDAGFRQTIKDQKGKSLNSSEGILLIKRPGRFYWKSETPDELLVVADGKIIWTYDIDLEQIVKQDQSESLGQSPAALLAGDVINLGKDYEIALVSSNQCKMSNDACYQLIPTLEESQFKKILIGFRKGVLSMIFIIDALDQSIDTRFSSIKLNGHVDDERFNFVPPPGVDVIKGQS